MARLYALLLYSYVFCVEIVRAQYSAPEKVQGVAKDTNQASTRYLYTTPARSIFGGECVGDCIDGTCVVTRQGDLEPCQNDPVSPRIVWYTSGILHFEYSKCKSACVGEAPSWCFVSHYGEWDYCNKEWKGKKDEYPLLVRRQETDFIVKCATPCKVDAWTQVYKCRRDRENWGECAPYGNMDLLKQPSAIGTDNAFLKCVSQRSLQRACRRRRQTPNIDDSDSDSGIDASACLARDNPDYVDTYREPDDRGIFRTVAPGTVAHDAAGLSDRGDTNNNPPHPLRSVTTQYNSQLDLNLPVVVRARIDAAAIDMAGPRPNGAIERAVPSLTSALRSVRYSHNGIPYDVGHMVGHLSGGQNADFNFAPQSATLNRGLWLSMENHIREWVDTGRPNAFVDMLIVIYYDNVERFLPLGFGVDLEYYYTVGSIASICHDMMYYNIGNSRKRHPRDVSFSHANYTGSA